MNWEITSFTLSKSPLVSILTIMSSPAFVIILRCPEVWNGPKRGGFFIPSSELSSLRSSKSFFISSNFSIATSLLSFDPAKSASGAIERNRIAFPRFLTPINLLLVAYILYPATSPLFSLTLSTPPIKTSFSICLPPINLCL